jgi:hypothetical protein
MSRKLRGKIDKGEFKPDFDVKELAKCVVSILGVDGKEYPNPESMFVDDAMGRPSTIEEQVARVLLKRNAQKAFEGEETLEEADDMSDVDEFENEEFSSPYEVKELAEEQPVMTAEPEPTEDQLKEEEIMINGEKYIKTSETSEDIAEATQD